MYTMDLVHERVRELRATSPAVEDLGSQRLRRWARRVRRH